MNRDLTDAEIERHLLQHFYGHLGCMLNDGRPYVVPVMFSYHNGALYCFSRGGWKVDAMRKNPAVCFQSESFVEEGVWMSVIVWGAFEELSGPQRLAAMKILFSRLESENGRAVSPLYQPPVGLIAEEAAQGMKKRDAVFYRINLTEKTGKRVQYE